MQKFIAFLRGINVGNIRIKMPDLQRAFSDMGYANPVTYLQTGNVVFSSDQTLAEIKTKLEAGLTATFNYQAYVLPYPFEALETIVEAYPFAPRDSHHDYVVFVENETTLAELAALAHAIPAGDETHAVGTGTVYWQVPKGSSLETPFAKILAKAKYKSTTTVRNINTLQKILNDN